jgi:hypothetical protein
MPPIANLSHYSSKPIESVRSTIQTGTHKQEGLRAQEKPYGLWLSVDGDDDWASWCHDEGFACGDKYHYRIHLARPQSILWISDALELHVFSECYEKRVDLSGYNAGKHRYIDWPAVAKNHTGIVIAPYQWSCSMLEDMFWYYSWDCASGCVWDADVIDRVELLGKKQIAREKEDR